jgi:outer membrane protein TolC
LQQINLELSRDRLTLTELKVNNGSETQLQLIQAKLDLTADQSNLLQMRKQLNDLKINLNYLLGRAANEPVIVQGIFNESPFLSWENALTIAKEQNSQLLMAKSRIAVSDMQRKEVQSLYFPQLSFFAQYTYGSSQNEVGILNSNRTFGPGIGLTFSWNILDRLSTYTAMKNSTINQENAHLAEQEQQLFVETELRKVYTDYEWANEQLQLEQQNILNVTETFSIARNSFENGALTSLELRNIQYAIVEAESRLLTSQLSLNITKLNLSLTTGNFKGLIIE